MAFYLDLFKNIRSIMCSISGNILKSIFFLVVLGLPVPNSASAQDIEDLNGIWWGKVSKNNGSIELQITIAGGFGELEFRDRLFTSSSSRRSCKYHFEFRGGDISETFLNNAWGSPALCMNKFPFDLIRVGEDMASFRPRNELLALLDFDKKDLRGYYYTPSAVTEKKSFSFLDIVGLRAGMKVTEARDVLRLAGYRVYNQPLLSSQKRAVLALDLENNYGDWARGSNVRGTPADLIRITWSAAIPNNPSEPWITAISRLSSYSTSDGITMKTLANALKDKYGPSNDWTGGLDRSWNLDGQMTTMGQRCGEGQKFRYEIGYVGYSRSSEVLFSSCGPSLDVKVSADKQMGIVTSLELILEDPTEMWRDYQRQWIYITAPKLQKAYESLSGIVPKKPEL